MNAWATTLWLAMGAGLVAYALTGGADLGAGLVSASAWGPRREAQREAVRKAIAPIWEANHVWLIFVIVVMFSVFPRAFATIGTALHIPIGLALVGLVLRGTAFTFHAYGIQSERSKRRWNDVFVWSSISTPVFLGTVVGAVSSGRIRVEQGRVTSGFWAGWTTPFAWLVGLFALLLFAMLASTYLAAETEGELAGDFRRRTIVTELVAGAVAPLVLWRAAVDAPELYSGLLASPWTWPLQGATALCAAATLLASYRHRFRWARYSAAAQVALVVGGWGAAMRGHLVVPDVTLLNAGSRPEVLPALVVALGIGSLLLGPSLWYLYRVFKRQG